MKRMYFIVFIVLFLVVGCSRNNEVNVNEGTEEPATEMQASPCAVSVGDCGDKPDWTKPKSVPARITDDELDPYTTPESLKADYMGEYQLRIIWMKKDQCAPKFEITTTLNDRTITLTCRDTASMYADCICIFPLYFDFDSLAYGPYTIVAGDVEHHIDFQPDMEMYEYEYK